MECRPVELFPTWWSLIVADIDDVTDVMFGKVKSSLKPSPDLWNDKRSSDIRLVSSSYPVLKQNMRFSLYASFGKRALDLFAVFLAVPVILPLILVFGLLVWLDGGNPIYSQLRVGRGGKSFRMWKLRSMRVDADAVLERVLVEDADLRAEWQTHQKLKNDPRITKIGRIIRKTSLDEIPQLWNVVMGEMSLVGPRPIMLSQKSIYPGQSYYALRPGLTGNWQVSARNESTFADRARFDEDYLKTMSLRTDLSILMKTVPAVVGGTGH